MINMKVLFLVQGWDRPSSKYRVLQYLPFLKKRGVRAKVIAYPRNIAASANLCREIKKYDILFLQKSRPGAFFLPFLRRQAKRIVYDLDDAIMYRDSNASSPYSRTRQRRFASMVKAADRVIAGNNFLADEARGYNEKVTVVPTAIDMQNYTVKEYRDTAKVTLGWLGSSSTLPYLERLKPVFEKLDGRYNNVKLKIICDTFFDCENMPVVKENWSAEREIEQLRSFDIGLMPLQDDLWSRGKCGLKILQYYGAGVPVVCTPVGVNGDVVRDGVNGYWARTDKEWIEKLSILIEDAGLRQRMGMRGRELVNRSFSLEHCAPMIYDVLKDVIL